MTLRVRVEQGGSADVGHLERLLAGEPELRGKVGIDRPRPAPGKMGIPIETLQVAVESAAAIAALVASLKAWFTPPRSRMTIRLERDGETLEVTADRIAEPEKLIRELKRLVDVNERR